MCFPFRFTLLPNSLKPFTHADLLRRCSRLQKICSVLNNGQFFSQTFQIGSQLCLFLAKLPYAL